MRTWLTGTTPVHFEIPHKHLTLFPRALDRILFLVPRNSIYTTKHDASLDLLSWIIKKKGGKNTTEDYKFINPCTNGSLLFHILEIMSNARNRLHSRDSNFVHFHWYLTWFILVFEIAFRMCMHINHDGKRKIRALAKENFWSIKLSEVNIE